MPLHSGQRDYVFGLSCSCERINSGVAGEFLHIWHKCLLEVKDEVDMDGQRSL